jgi:hypothetical protein
MLTCLKCKSQRVTKGMVAADAHSPAIFRPQGLRPLSFTFLGGTELSEEGFACLDCDLVWSSTPPDKLNKFMGKHCDEIPGTPEA